MMMYLTMYNMNGYIITIYYRNKQLEMLLYSLALPPFHSFFVNERTTFLIHLLNKSPPWLQTGEHSYTRWNRSRLWLPAGISCLLRYILPKSCLEDGSSLTALPQKKWIKPTQDSLKLAGINICCDSQILPGCCLGWLCSLEAVQLAVVCGWQQCRMEVEFLRSNELKTQ